MKRLRRSRAEAPIGLYMVGLPWTAHGVVCSFYLSLCKSDHKEGGITFEAAKASNFTTTNQPAGSDDSPAI